MATEPAARTTPTIRRDAQSALYQRALETLPGGTDSNFRAWGESTIYVDRTLPAHFKPGRVLSERDCIELHDMIDRSSSHNRRLYGEISRLQTELGQTLLSRLIQGVRRLLARGRLR